MTRYNFDDQEISIILDGLDRLLAETSLDFDRSLAAGDAGETKRIHLDMIAVQALRAKLSGVRK